MASNRNRNNRREHLPDWYKNIISKVVAVVTTISVIGGGGYFLGVYKTEVKNDIQLFDIKQDCQDKVSLEREKCAQAERERNLQDSKELEDISGGKINRKK